MDKDEDDLPNIDEAELYECEKFENLYLIGFRYRGKRS